MQEGGISNNKSIMRFYSGEKTVKKAVLRVCGSFLLAVFASGCATSGRYIVFKEYQPNLPAKESKLKGKTVYIGSVSFERNATRKDQTKPVDPPGFEFRRMSSEEKAKWNQEFKLLRKNFIKSDDNRVGSLRNGYGMVMSGIFALNDPAVWFKECLEAELKAKGATLGATPEGSDLQVSAAIVWLDVDAYMKAWADLVVDVNINGNGIPPRQKTLHAGGASMSWSSSSFEFYNVVRESEQKIMQLIIEDLSSVIK